MKSNKSQYCYESDEIFKLNGVSNITSSYIMSLDHLFHNIYPMIPNYSKIKIKFEIYLIGIFLELIIKFNCIFFPRIQMAYWNMKNS